MANQRHSYSFISRIAVGIALVVTATEASAAIAPNTNSLRKELAARKGSSFESILRKWELSYGTQAIDPLLELVGAKAASSTPSKPKTSLPDADRYVAIMGIAKIGGPAVAPRLTGLLKDSSWMIRSATLKALSALKNPQTAQAVLPLLKDPALVVRMEAVDAIQKLKPAGARAALEAAVKDPANYHGGKPLWVPQKAQAALKSLK